VFNMMPIMPLDGGRILAEFVPSYHRLVYSENGQWIMLGAFLLFFWFGIDYVFRVSLVIASAADGIVSGVLSLI